MSEDLSLKVRCEECKIMMKNEGFSHEIEIGDNDLSGWVLECPNCKKQIVINLSW